MQLVSYLFLICLKAKEYLFKFARGATKRKGDTRSEVFAVCSDNEDK